MAWHGIAWRHMAWHGMAWRDMAWHGVTWHGMAWLAHSMRTPQAWMAWRTACATPKLHSHTLVLHACPLRACRLMRDMQSRTQQEHSEKLAASNAAIVRHAARALIRNCDTLQLMGIQPANGSSAGGGAAEGGSHGPAAAGGHRISGLICFDEMQVHAAWQDWVAVAAALPPGRGVPLAAQLALPLPEVTVPLADQP